MLKNRLFTSVFMMLAMAGVANAAYDGTLATPETDTDGCYLIGSAAELYGFAAIVNGTLAEERDAEPTACGKLTADIVVNEHVLKTAEGKSNVCENGVPNDCVDGVYIGDASGFHEWTPIGSFNNPFAGTFDGQGHTISGLFFNEASSEVSNVGLFGTVDYFGEEENVSVSISNVGIEDSYFKAGYAVGGVIGFFSRYIEGNVETWVVKNVYNAAVVVGSMQVGGIIGYVDLVFPLTMVNVYNVGSIICTSPVDVGGLVGYLFSDNAVSIKNSYNYGNVVGVEEESFVNGDPLVGQIDDSGVGTVTVTNSFTIVESKFDGNGATRMNPDDFVNGVAFAQLYSAEDGEVWRQYENDAYPTFAAKTGTDAPSPMHVAVLHYSETDSVVAYTEGTAKSLPTADADGNVFIWYAKSDLTGTKYSEIPATATSDLEFYSKKMNLVDGYYEISDADMLFKFAELVNTQNSTYGSAKVKLTADIVVNENVLTTAEGTSNVCENGVPNDCLDGAYIGSDSASFRKWTPIGDNISGNQIPFKGSFDGQGHTISGLYLNKEIVSGNEYSALFGIVDGNEVSIKNVGIEDSYFAAQRYVGGIIGRSVAKMLEIENCYNAATLYGINGLGGLVGELNSSDNSLKIENSYNFGTIKYDTSTGGLPAQTGALVGQGQGKTEVLNSFYLEQGGVKSKFGTAASSDAFANGTVATLLHGTDADSLWGQNVTGGESHPTFFKGINVEVGPGVIAGGPETSTITLSYPDATYSSFTYVEGWGASLPEKDKKGDYVIWYDDSGNFYNEVSSTVSGDLDLHAVVFKPGNDGFYEIDDVAKLYKFAAIVNGGNGDVNAKLTADIEVNKNVLATAGGVSNVNTTTGAYTGNTTGLREWTPIGYCDEDLNYLPFTGIFDGQGHTISGLYYNDEDAYDVGLFGYVEGDGSTIIKNVGVEDSYFKAFDIAGGILGEYGGGNAASIENVYSAAVVVAGEDAWAGIGGVVGTAWYGDLTVTNAYNVGSVIGGGSMGGIVGDIEDCSATIKNSFNYGNVAGEPLVGSVDGADVSVTNSFYLGDAANGDYGDFKSATEFADGTVFAALHSAKDGEVWRQYDGDDYPTLVAKTGTGAPAPMHVAVLHYSETDSVVIAYTKGTAFMLPTTLPDGSIVVGDWYKSNNLSGDTYTQIAATEDDDLAFYAKAMKLGSDGYYEISDADELYAFASAVNNDSTFATAKAKLTADICVNACGEGESVLGTDNANVDADGNYIGADSASFRKWIPIGSSSKPFKGLFDGQGYTISGLYSNSTSGTAGLFGFVDGYARAPANVSIQNVGVEDSYFKAKAIDGKTTYAGGILADVGENASANLENVYSSAVAVAPSAGGIIGEFYGIDLSVTNAFNVGDVVGTTYGGGLVGYVEASGSVDITNGYNYETSMNGNGALLGRVGNGSNTPTVTNSYYLASKQVGVYGDFKSATEFADGTVYAALHSGENVDVWFLKPGDKYPTLSQEKNGPAVYEVTLNYPKAGSTSEYDPETISYVEGFAKSLPTMDKNGNPILGWYTTGSESSPITEISTSTTGAMTLFPKMYEPVNGCYEIATADQLYLFAAVVNGGNSTACGKLTANIVVNGNVLGTDNANVDANGNYIGSATGLREWTPIGSSSSNPFTGSFDGQGHSISGLYFNDANANDVGLFGVVAASAIETIRNVGVVDSYFKGGDNVGAVTGRIACTSTCSVAIEASFNESVVVGNDNVGGIIGDVNGGANTHFYLSNAYNVGTVIGSVDFGGLVGSAEAGVYGSVTHVFNYGTVSNGGGNIVGALDVSSSVGIDFSYYLGNGDGANSAKEFADGTVLAELQKHGGVYIWKQGEKYPVFGSYEPVNGCYEIANASQLYWFAAIVNNGNTNACGKLVADIEVNENVLGIGNANVNADGEYIGSNSASFSKWTPIGNSSNPFTGSFDGQGHTISGLYFNGENVYDVGLFGRVAGDDDGASVTNVNVADSYFGDKGETGDHVGGIVGMVAQGGTVAVKNVSSAAVVVGNDDVGGIVGYVLGTEGNLDLDITNAYHVGMVKGSDDVGGLVGDVTIDRAEHKVAINNSYNYGDVSFKMTDGGAPLIGSVKNTAGVATIDVDNSYYLSAEKVDGDNAAMTAGEFADGTVLVALRSGEDGYVWVQASGDKYPAIDINASKNANTIVLDWASAADSTTLADAGYTNGAMVIVKSGKQFYAGGAIYEGILSAEQVAAIGENKLYPISGVELEVVEGKLVATLDGDSNKPLMIPTDIAVDKVVYSRELTPGDFKTVTLPFEVSDLKTSSLTNYAFYKFSSMEENQDGYRYMAMVYRVGKLSANKPYIMRNVGKSTSNGIVFEGTLTLKATSGVALKSSATSVDGVTWSMTGVYEYKQWQADDPEIGRAYLFAAQAQDGYKIGEFAKVGAGAYLLPMRMYLLRELPTSAKRPGMSRMANINGTPETIGVKIVDEELDENVEETTVVKHITVVPMASQANRWFDMKGRTLNGKPTAKGTYYHNGQRIIIK